MVLRHADRTRMCIRRLYHGDHLAQVLAPGALQKIVGRALGRLGVEIIYYRACPSVLKRPQVIETIALPRIG